MAEDDDSFWRSPTSQELLQQFLNLLGAETEWVWEQVTESSRHGQYLHPALAVFGTAQAETGKWRTFISVGTYAVIDTEPLDAYLALENCLFWSVRKKDGGGPK